MDDWAGLSVDQRIGILRHLGHNAKFAQARSMAELTKLAGKNVAFEVSDWYADTKRHYTRSDR